MKYVPLRDFENVTSALNFHTADCHVVGGCDLYTTKAAGNDKKLYKNIESSLESQHESLMRLSASLSPPNAEQFSLNLSRSSPFGPLSQVSSRRTFAYIIATLNASHPDYDFSQVLRPSDFRKERSLKGVTGAIDETLYNLRPRPTGAILAGPTSSNNGAGGPRTPGGSQTWNPRMWRLIDNEMTLRECEIYSYAPDEDPFDGEESAIWSLHYFFFNKNRKRVCYIHLRGLSISSHSPVRSGTAQKAKRSRPISGGLSFGDNGASKRARYWLGDKADDWEDEGPRSKEDDDSGSVIAEPGDDEVDADDALGASDVSARGLTESDDEDEIERRYKTKSRVRRMSEHIAESMEV